MGIKSLYLALQDYCNHALRDLGMCSKTSPVFLQTEESIHGDVHLTIKDTMNMKNRHSAS